MTSQKTEKKRISSKIFVALAALTLVSCCFLGTTFARYTTGDMTGNAGTDIADWEIVIEDGTTGGTEAGEFAVISPAMSSEFNSDTPRKNEVEGSSAIVKITNNGQVEAEVTVTLDGELTYWVKNYVMEGGQVARDDDGSLKWVEAELVDDNGNTRYRDQQGREYIWDDTQKAPQYLDNGTWKAKTEWGTDIGLDDIIAPGTLSVVGGTESPIIIDTGKSVTLAISNATWTTDQTGDTAATTGDARDTWIGENVSKVGYTFTWKAEQASQIPAAN